MKARLLRTIKGGRRKEAQLHRTFKQHRVTGEWFRDCAEIRTFIRSVENIPCPETVACRMAVEQADKLRELARREGRTVNFLLNKFAREALRRKRPRSFSGAWRPW
jgi:hypothetical protein